MTDGMKVLWFWVLVALLTIVACVVFIGCIGPSSGALAAGDMGELVTTHVEANGQIDRYRSVTQLRVQTVDGRGEAIISSERSEIDQVEVDRDGEMVVRVVAYLSDGSMRGSIVWWYGIVSVEIRTADGRTWNGYGRRL
jgi:hypothetical protein